MDNERVVLGVSNLVKSFGRIPILKGLSFDVKQGEVTTLLGPTGAGKTTTLKAIMGMVSFAGEISVFDSTIGSVIDRVAFVPQEKSFYSQLNAEKTIRLAKRLTAGFNESEARMYMADLGIPEKKISLLPSGMRSALYLSIALAQNAGLFLLDEPTTGMDPVMREDALELIRRKVIDGASVLMASHSIPDAESISDNIVVIQNGTKQFEGALDDIKKGFRVYEFAADRSSVSRFADFFAVNVSHKRCFVLGKGQEEWNRLDQTDYVSSRTPDLESFYRIIAGKSNVHSSQS